jgi:hypothetical protein
MDRCNKKYTELLLKMIHMENRIAELEDILYITDELSLEPVTPKVLEEDVLEEEEPVASLEVVELEEIEEEPVASLEVVELEEIEEEPVAPKVVELELKEVDNFDAGELVDLSTEEKETNPNPNKKGWVKTLLFL